MTGQHHTPTLTLDPLSEAVQTLDALIDRHVTLSLDIARLKQQLADLAEERRVREAVLALAIEGRNEGERQARHRLTLCADADYRRLTDQERTLRGKLAEAEARLWSTQKRFAVCLCLLKLAAAAETSTDDGADEDEEDRP